MKRFLAGMSQAQQTDGSDKDQTRFDEEFAAIEPIHGVIFQAGIGEQAVPEKSGSCEINRKMEGLPKMAAQSDAQVGSAYYKCDEVQRESANGVVKGLRRRMYGIDEVEDKEARIFVQEQNHGMEDRQSERNVAGPVVKPEIIESMIWPGAVRAVAEGHE